MALGEDRPINQWNIIENNITFPTNGTGTWTFTGQKEKKKKGRNGRREEERPKSHILI